MEFSEVIKKRRSIRRFTNESIPSEIIEKALYFATLAPNSSNTQTWDFYWVQSSDKKQNLITACLNQSAARTASELIVIVAAPLRWKRSQSRLIDWAKQSGAPDPVIQYYQKLIPVMYRWGIFNVLGLFKMLSFFVIGMFRPIVRRPAGRRDIQEVAIKSAALAAQNFVLSITNAGYSSCMMEGFDEVRVKKILNLNSSDRVAMVIAVGKEAEKGTWGEQYRIPTDEVIHRI